jgi:hypothetical protein
VTLLQFASESPYLTFGVAWLASALAFRVVNRILRTVKVAVRGWPPPHLDADGDFREGGS